MQWFSKASFTVCEILKITICAKRVDLPRGSKEPSTHWTGLDAR